MTEWGAEGLVEIVVLSGFYQMFAAINQGFDMAAGRIGDRHEEDCSLDQRSEEQLWTPS